MTDAKSRVGALKAAVVAFAILYAAAALTVLATAKVNDPRTGDRPVDGSLELGSLAR